MSTTSHDSKQWLSSRQRKEVHWISLLQFLGGPRPFQLVLCDLCGMTFDTSWQQMPTRFMPQKSQSFVWEAVLSKPRKTGLKTWALHRKPGKLS